MNEAPLLEFFLTQEVQRFMEDLKAIGGLPAACASWSPGERWRSVIFAGMWAAADKLNLDKDDYFDQMRPVFRRSNEEWESDLWTTLMIAWEYVNPGVDAAEPDLSSMMDGDSEHRTWTE